MGQIQELAAYLAIIEVKLLDTTRSCTTLDWASGTMPAHGFMSLNAALLLLNPPRRAPPCLCLWAASHCNGLKCLLQMMAPTSGTRHSAASCCSRP